MKTTDVPTPWKTPVEVTRTKSKWQVTRSPTGWGLLVSICDTMTGSPPVGVNVAVALSDWMTYVCVLPTTCPGVKSPLPLNAASTVCPLSHVNGIVVVLGSAEAAGAKAIAATAPEMTVAHMRLSMRMFLSLQDVSGRPAQGTPMASVRSGGRGEWHRGTVRSSLGI